MKDHIARRYVLFACGLTVISMAIAIITKASLGTSPITSIPYSLSMVFTSLTLGNWTIIFSLLLVALQFVMRFRERDEYVHLALQIVVSFLFGYIIDIGMAVFSWFDPQEYIVKIMAVIVGCALLAFGVYLQVIANVVMVPGDGFAYTLTMKLRKDYGKVRVTSDTTMIVIAALIGIACLGTLGGVREGTVISAVLVGTIARFYMKKLAPLTDRLLPPAESPGSRGE